MAQSHYTLKIVIQEAGVEESEKTTGHSEEGQSDSAVYAARKRAKDIIKVREDKSLTAREKFNQLAFGADEKDRAKKLKAAKATWTIAGISTLKTIGGELMFHDFKNSGNTALMNARTNDRTAFSDLAGGASAVLGGFMFGGIWGAVAAGVGVAISGISDLRRQVLELQYETRIWKDEARKTSERLGFDATKRNRYTYNY